jgi:hypothetical protein
MSDTQVTITCYDCTGKGYTLFCGNEADCKPCGNTGELVVCESYVSLKSIVVFRNQPCHNCGVKQNDHGE